MPIPILMVAAAGAAATGIGAAGHGAVKMKNANDTMKEAEKRNKNNMDKMEAAYKRAIKIMDDLGKREMEVQSSFQDFADVIEKIQNRPEFSDIEVGGAQIPKYELDELKKVSVGAGFLLGGLAGAVAGTAGGFAASGATTAAVVAFGTASTGVPITSLSGAAAANATLAALGGGSLAAGGGGIALGTTVLGVSTLGVGLLVGGIIFQITSTKLSSKANEAYAQTLEAEKKMKVVLDYLQALGSIGKIFLRSFDAAAMRYEKHLNKLKSLVYDEGKANWIDYDSNEKLYVQNTVLLVGLLYKMCQVNLVIKNESKDAVNKVNKNMAYKVIDEAKMITQNIQVSG